MDPKLTTWERLTISQLIGRLQGDAALMHKAIKVFDAVELTEEEKEEIKLRQVGDSLVWDERERRWEVALSTSALPERSKLSKACFSAVPPPWPGSTVLATWKAASPP